MLDTQSGIFLLLLLLKGEAFKRSSAEEQIWPGLEVVGEEFNFHLEIPVVSGCQERTPRNRPLGQGNAWQFWEPTKTYLTPADWDGGQYIGTATLRRGGMGKKYLGTPQRHCTSCPGTSDHYLVSVAPWAGQVDVQGCCLPASLAE